MFADGGPSGEEVVEDVVRFAARALSDRGALAIVCEVHGDPEALGRRVAKWWTEAGGLTSRVAKTKLSILGRERARARARPPLPHTRAL